MTIDVAVKKVAERIRQYRELRGLTREQFCEEIGINTEYWGSIERGEHDISLRRLLEICLHFDISVDDLIRLNAKKSDNRELIIEIETQLPNLTEKQLLLLRQFMNEILLQM